MDALALPNDVDGLALPGKVAGAVPTMFSDMGGVALDSLDTRIFLDDVQARLSEVLLAVGMQVGEWGPVPGRRPDVTLASIGRSMRVQDPLNGDAHDVTLRVTLRSMSLGCMLQVRVDVRNIATGRVFATCDPFSCSWPEHRLVELAATLKQAFAALVRTPRSWDGAHFETLAHVTSGAMAP